MGRTRINEGTGRDFIGRECQGNRKGIGIRKSRCVELNIISYADKVNATLRQCSIFLRVADYSFESTASAFVLGAKALAAWALAAADLEQSQSACPFSPQ